MVSEVVEEVMVRSFIALIIIIFSVFALNLLKYLFILLLFICLGGFARGGGGSRGFGDRNDRGGFSDRGGRGGKKNSRFSKVLTFLR